MSWVRKMGEKPPFWSPRGVPGLGGYGRASSGEGRSTTSSATVGCEKNPHPGVSGSKPLAQTLGYNKIGHVVERESVFKPILGDLARREPCARVIDPHCAPR